MTPTKIYLQVKDDDGKPAEEITWSLDRIHETDEEYLRLADAIAICEYWEKNAIAVEGRQIAAAIKRELGARSGQ